MNKEAFEQNMALLKEIFDEQYPDLQESKETMKNFEHMLATLKPKNTLEAFALGMIFNQLVTGSMQYYAATNNGEIQ